MCVLRPDVSKFYLFLCLSMLACTETKSTPGAAEESAKGAEEPSSAKTPSGGSELPDKSQKSATKDKSGKGDAPGTACLVGKWHYDFADNALETMMANLPKGKVTKEEGDLVCENTLVGVEGTVTCAATGGKPVVIEVAADQAGMPLTISVKMSGKTSSKFKLVDDKTMQVTSEGMGDLKVEVEATIAGNKIPFPTAPLLQAFAGEMGATSVFECQGDTLRIRPQIAVQTSWQEFTRLK